MAVSFTLKSDAVLIPPITFTLASDAVLIPPKNFTTTSDSFLLPPNGQLLLSDALLLIGHPTIALTSDAYVSVPSSCVLASSPNPSIIGNPVVFTITVLGSTTPTGTVQFFDSALLLGTATLVSGSADFTPLFLSPGPHFIKSIYLGDGSHDSTSCTLLQNVTSPPPDPIPNPLPGDCTAVTCCPPSDLLNNRITLPSGVANGSFESGIFDPWALGAGTGGTTVGSLDSPPQVFAHSGIWYATLGQLSSGSISQNVITARDASYMLSFWYKNVQPNASPNNYLRVVWDGVVVWSVTNAPATIPYIHVTVGVTGSGYDNLKFTFSNIHNQFIFDDVTLTLI